MTQNHRTARPLWTAAFFAAVATLLLVSGAHADVKLTVVNCAADPGGKDWKYPICSYDAKDSSKTVSADQKKLKFGQSGSLKCAGEGKGYCKIQPIGIEDDCDKISAVQGNTFKLDKNKTHVFYCPEGKQDHCNKDGGPQEVWEVKKNLDVDPDDVNCKDYNKNY